MENLEKSINAKLPDRFTELESLSIEYIQWLDSIRKKSLQNISPFIFNVMTRELNKNNGHR